MPDLASASSVTGDEWTDIGELVALVRRRPAFHADAACREAPPEVSWFPERGQTAELPREVCDRCLVAGECKAWALDQDGALEGIWAGMSKADRLAARRLEAA